MDEETARKILNIPIGSNLLDSTYYMNWIHGNDTIILDGHFTLSQLEALVWWMRNM